MSEVTERDLRMPEFRDAKLEDLEFRADGKIVRKDRWEMGIRAIRSALGDSRRDFEVVDVVQAVKALVESMPDHPELTAWGWINHYSPLFLDAETTGLGDTDQVIELSVVDENGEVLFSQLIRPTVPVHPEAAAVNGIPAADLEAANSWQFWHGEVKALLDGRLVICHNAEFDRRLLGQTCAARGLKPITAEWGCTQDLLLPLNDGRRPNLARAAEIAGVEIDPTRQHRSEYDADVVRRIVAALATRYEESQ